MLTRIAGNAFWMARYLERAENNALLLRMAMLHATWPEGREAPGLWSTALEVGGTLDDYQARIGAVTPAAVVRFMITDRDNPSSLVACWRAVRDNARTARNLLGETAWELINETWLQAQAIAPGDLDDPQRLSAWCSERCRLTWGAFADLWRDALPHVLDLGGAVERADVIARILAELLPGLLAGGAEPPPVDSAAARRWRALLLGLGLTDSWRRAERGALGPVPVLRLVLLHPTSPHSLSTTVRRMVGAIDGFAGAGRGGATRVLAGALAAEVAALDLGELLVPAAAAAFTARLTAATNRIGAEAVREHFA